MNTLTLIMIGFSLAMDAFSVSVSQGMCMKKEELIRKAILLATLFALFQAAMPLIGYMVGQQFYMYIQHIDHYIAFILLVYLGVQLYRSDAQDEKQSTTIKQYITLAIATSIDALAVGISFSFLHINIIEACVYIGVITLLCCFVGVLFGKALSGYFAQHCNKVGGVVLIIIGCKILIESLFF